MLYETQERKVKLENEIEYLRNYIDLQLMRFSNEVTVNLDIKGETNSKTIAPMMLITLVENAFKHGISPARKTSIAITLDTRDDKISFRVENDKIRNRARSKLEKDSGGVGLPNLRKRLNMIYPNQHRLDIEERNGRFIANMELV